MAVTDVVTKPLSSVCTLWPCCFTVATVTVDAIKAIRLALPANTPTYAVAGADALSRSVNEYRSGTTVSATTFGTTLSAAVGTGVGKTDTATDGSGDGD
jgi:hypothetical protein